MICYEYTGVTNASTTSSATCNGEGKAVVDACPTAGLVGSCTLGLSVPGYYTGQIRNYYEGDAASHESECSTTGGTWSAP